MNDIRWLSFAPSFPEGSDGASLLADFARALATLPKCENDKERNAAVDVVRRRALKARTKCDAAGRQHLVASIHVLADLVRQGWVVRTSEEGICIGRGGNGHEAADQARERIRGQLHA